MLLAAVAENEVHDQRMDKRDEITDNRRLAADEKKSKTFINFHICHLLHVNSRLRIFHVLQFHVLRFHVPNLQRPQLPQANS